MISFTFLSRRTKIAIFHWTNISRIENRPNFSPKRNSGIKCNNCVKMYNSRATCSRRIIIVVIRVSFFKSFRRKDGTMNAIGPSRVLDEVDWLLLAGQTFYARERQESRSASSSLSVARSSNHIATNSSDGDGAKCENSGGIGELMNDVASDRATLARFAARCVSRSDLELEWSHVTTNEIDERSERVRRLANAKLIVYDEETDSLAMRVRSYGIARTWNLLRHVYLELDDVEIHSGMTEDESRQIVYTTRDYFGAGRIEGYLSLCRACTSDFIVDVRHKTNEFFLPVNNCDTIVPFVMQTPTIWFGALGAIIGTMLSIRTHNFFTFALFVPLITFCLTAFYNSRILDAEDRTECELARCVHVACDQRGNRSKTAIIS